MIHRPALLSQSWISQVCQDDPPGARSVLSLHPHHPICSCLKTRREASSYPQDPSRTCNQQDLGRGLVDWSCIEF